MKYQGKVIEGKNRRVLRIKKGAEILSLDIIALDFGWIERLRNLPSFKVPSPPRKVVYDEKGMLVKNKETGQLEMVADVSNQAWSDKYNLATKRFDAVSFYGHLKDDQNIEFEQRLPEGDTDGEWAKFADQMWDEIISSGFTESEIEKVIEVGQELACEIVTDEDIANFSSSPGQDNPEDSEASSKMKLDNDLSPQPSTTSTG